LISNPDKELVTAKLAHFFLRIPWFYGQQRLILHCIAFSKLLIYNIIRTIINHQIFRPHSPIIGDLFSLPKMILLPISSDNFCLEIQQLEDSW
jgi:hypothetical protein